MRKEVISFRLALLASHRLSQFFVVCVALTTLAPGGSGQDARPELVWEKEFDRDVLAAGVDTECLRECAGNAGPCLKWILLEGEGYHFGAAGDDEKSVRVISSGIRYPDNHISRSGKYLLVPARIPGSGAPEREFYYTLYDWNGEAVWQARDKRSLVFVRDDGSSVFLGGPQDIRKDPLKDIMFFGRSGRRTSTYRFSELQYMGTRTTQALSNSYFALATANAELDCLDVHVFDKSGKLVWKTARFNTKYTDDPDKTRRYVPRSLAVSDSGEVMLWLRDGNVDTKALIYDASGVLRDTLVYQDTDPQAARAYGRLAFATIQPRSSKNKRLLCYDFEKMRVQFVLEKPGIHWVCDVNQGENEVAISVNEDENCVEWMLQIYDLSGKLRSAVSVETQYLHSPWCRTLGGTLLAADRNSLRLYNMKGGE